MIEGVKKGDIVYVKRNFWEIRPYHYPGVEPHMKDNHGKSFEVVAIIDDIYVELKLPHRTYLYPIEWLEIDDENYKFKQLLLKN